MSGKSWISPLDRWYLLRIELNDIGRAYYGGWTLEHWKEVTEPGVLAVNRWTTSRHGMQDRVEMDFLVQAPTLGKAYESIDIIEHYARQRSCCLWHGDVGDFDRTLSRSLGERVAQNEYVKKVLRTWRTKKRRAAVKQSEIAKMHTEMLLAQDVSWVKASDKWVVLDCHWTDSPMPATSEMPPRVVAWQSVGPNEAKLLVQVNTPKNVRDVLVHVNSPVWKETWCGAVGCLPLSESTWIEAAHYVEVLTQHHVLLQKQREEKEKAETKHDLEAATSWVTLEDNWYHIQAECKDRPTCSIHEQHAAELKAQPRILTATVSNAFLVQARTRDEATDAVMDLPNVTAVMVTPLGKAWASWQVERQRAYVLPHANLVRLAYEELQRRKGKAPAAAPDAQAVATPPGWALWRIRGVRPVGPIKNFLDLGGIAVTPATPEKDEWWAITSTQEYTLFPGRLVSAGYAEVATLQGLYRVGEVAVEFADAARRAGVWALCVQRLLDATPGRVVVEVNADKLSWQAWLEAAKRHCDPSDVLEAARQAWRNVADPETWRSDTGTETGTETGRGEEEMANNQEEKSLVSKIVDEAKDSAADAAWRTGGRQLVKLTQEPLVALLQRHLDLNDDSARVKIASFLSTDVGKALVGAVLSMGLAVVPGDEKLKAVTQRLARELRVESMALMGDLVAEVVMGPLRQVIALYLQDLGGAVEQAVPKELAAAPVAPGTAVTDVTDRVVDMPRRTKAQ